MGPAALSSEPKGLRPWIDRVLRELRTGRSGHFLRQLGQAILWQVLGKLLQFVGVAYAMRCLGPDSVGVSGNVFFAAMFGQLVLDLGLEIIAVRQVASGRATARDIVPTMFSLRLLLASIALVLWIVVACSVPMAPSHRQVWIVGGFHLFFLSLNFSWYFQATDGMARFSLIQNVTTVLTSVWFLGLFHEGQRVGSDLAVTMAMNGICTVGVWVGIARSQKTNLFSLGNLDVAWGLMKEARPTWLFNLSYYALSSMGLPLCFYILGEREGGYYRSAAMLVGTLQVFLGYFALMLNPRIVRWRTEEPGKLRQRLTWLTAGIVVMSLVVFVAFWVVRRPVISLLGPKFLPAADILPALVSAKFLALASGLLVWGLLANHEAWLAVRCVVVPSLAALALNLLLIRSGGILAAAWLSFASEAVLLVLCYWSFNRVEKRRLTKS